MKENNNLNDDFSLDININAPKKPVSLNAKPTKKPNKKLVPKKTDEFAWEEYVLESANTTKEDGNETEQKQNETKQETSKDITQTETKNKNALSQTEEKPDGDVLQEDISASQMYAEHSPNQGNTNSQEEEKQRLLEEKMLKKQEQLVLKQEKQRAKKEKREQQKKFNKEYKNSYIYGFIFILASILLEVCNMARLGLGFLPTNFGIEFSIILMIAGFIFLVPTEPFKIALMSTFFGVQLIMNIANASLYKMMYDIITVDMIFTLGFETADAFELNQLDLTSLVTCGFVLVLFILAIIFGNKFAPRFKIKKNKRAIISLLVLIFSIEVLGISSLKISEFIYFHSQDKAQYLFEDNEYMYNTLNAKFASMKKYGFWSFYINNASVFFNYEKDLSKQEMQELTEYITLGENFKYSNSLHNGQNVSGSLAGDNLIVIMMESFEWFAIDPINTPHLYEFIEDYSVKFTNFCARNKTNLSEEITMLGSIVNEYSFTTINDKVGINTPNSLPNLIKDSGIKTANFFHDYTGEMYDRNTLNKAFGFDNVYTMKECPIENKSEYFGDFLDDGDFVNAYKNQFMPNDKSFFSFFTTVTTHGPYETPNDRYTEYYNRFDSNYQQYTQWVKDENLGYSTPLTNTKEYNILKEYKSKAMAMDNAINVILNYLKTTKDGNNKPLYDNTTIVLYSDHNAYYSNLCYDVKGLNQYDNNKELYNIPFAIFNKDLPSGEVDTFCNTYDIFPTICDLYGIEFNNSLTQGYSVFSNDIENSVFVSTMCGMFNDDFYTVTFDDYTAKDNSLITSSKLNKFKQNINKFLQKQQYIEKYYRINYQSNANK